MTNNPKVSFIIPTYNSAENLRNTINSVLNQTYQDFEIILVDDGSEDNTDEVANHFQFEIHYLKQDNQGPGAARNTGINVASGSHLVFLDADDILFPNKLETQVSYLDDNPDVGVVFSDVLSFYRDANDEEVINPYPTALKPRRAIGPPDKTLEVLAIQNLFPPLSAMVRRDCVESVSGYDEDRALAGVEDWDLWFRVAHHVDFSYLDEIVGKYRILQSSVSRDKSRMKNASVLFQQKIIKSQGFSNFSNKVKADFYFYWGVLWLDYVEIERALEHFQKSIQLKRDHLLAHSAILVTKILGERAVFFYHLKRKLFGPRQSF